MLLLLACQPPPPSPGEPCNGSVAACDRPLPDVVFPGAHNAMSNEAEGWLAPNQLVPPAAQLDAGVRAMLVDTYTWRGDTWLCHTLCEAGATPLTDFLTALAEFLDAHPREVVLLIVQDAAPHAAALTALEQAGLVEHLLGPPWPTLGEAIAADTRLVWTVESEDPDAPPWATPFYGVGWDTPYTFRRPEDFTCDPFRGDASHELFLINHWISNPLPDRSAAAQVNTAAALHERVAACEARHGRLPTVLAVDFATVGDAVVVARELNERP